MKSKIGLVDHSAWAKRLSFGSGRPPARRRSPCRRRSGRAPQGDEGLAQLGLRLGAPLRVGQPAPRRPCRGSSHDVVDLLGRLGPPRTATSGAQEASGAAPASPRRTGRRCGTGPRCPAAAGHAVRHRALRPSSERAVRSGVCGLVTRASLCVRLSARLREPRFRQIKARARGFASPAAHVAETSGRSSHALCSGTVIMHRALSDRSLRAGRVLALAAARGDAAACSGDVVRSLASDAGYGPEVGGGAGFRGARSRSKERRRLHAGGRRAPARPVRAKSAEGTRRPWRRSSKAPAGATRPQGRAAAERRPRRRGHPQAGAGAATIRDPVVLWVGGGQQHC